MAPIGLRRPHPWGHLDFSGQRADVHLTLVGRHLLAGQGAEHGHAAEPEEAPAVDRIEAHRAPGYFFTTTVSFISVG